MVTSAPERIARLSQVSARRVLEPDDAVTGNFRAGQIVPDDLLLTVDLDVSLTAAAKATVSREQTAAMLAGGVRLEAVLMGGFGLLLASWSDVTDPRVEYLLHEIGEETRHSRLFARMVGQLEPRAVNPYHRGISAAITRAIYRLIVNNPVLLCVMVLAGEEIPDLIQRQAIDHPDTDDYLRRASIYHREEEARHIAFAGVLLPELWERASHRQRLLATHIAPLLIDLMLETQLCHPGIYEAAGLPGARTSRAVRRRPAYRKLRADGTRPVLKALKAAAPKIARRTPRGWRRITATA